MKMNIDRGDNDRIRSLPLLWAAAGLLLLPLLAGNLAHASDGAKDQKSGQDQTMTESAQGTAQDIRMHVALEAKLAQSDELSALAIGTDVQDGVVRLEGKVDSGARKELATELARSVDGVKSVRNDLQVVGGESGLLEKMQQAAGEGALTARVKTRLLASQNTSGLDIDVSTEDDVVTLEGAVGSETERELAELIAANTAGVAQVRNELDVHDR